MNGNYHIIRIQQYLNGELSKEEMHRLEREALDDPLLQDAIDGYRMRQEVSHRRLSLLQQRLAARIAGQTAERNAFYFGWQRLAVAATACVLMVVVLVLLWMRNHPNQPQPAEKEVEVELTAPGATTLHAAAAGDSGFDGRPAAGWEHFNAYLSNRAAGVAIKGKILLTFEIDAEGRPTAIHATENTDTLLLDELQQLLEQGPRWQGTKGKITVTAE